MLRPLREKFPHRTFEVISHFTHGYVDYFLVVDGHPIATDVIEDYLDAKRLRMAASPETRSA